MTELQQRLAGVRDRIRAACARAHRDPAGVRLIAVSKYHPVSAIRQAYAAGQRDFGESYAQELSQKAALLSDLSDLRFRFIGKLQRNKLKLLVGTGCAIETLASAAAANALQERAQALGLAAPIDVMIQVNLSAEPQKGGVGASEVPGLVAHVRALTALRLSGLMTIPKADDPPAARAAYRELRTLAHAQGLPQLSMGMSEDLEIAIEEGATSVRVGSAIFGPRPAIKPLSVNQS